jgi:hypothetical protein
MADDSGLEGKSLRPVRKSKQIAEDMRLAMIMASQLSKQIDREEKVSETISCRVFCMLLTLHQSGRSFRL